MPIKIHVHPRWGFFISAAVLFFLISPLSADDVFLKNGREYQNVQVIPKENWHFIIFEDGRMIGVANSEIQTVKIRGVRRKRRFSDEEIQRFIDERVRTEVQKSEERLKRLEKKYRSSFFGRFIDGPGLRAFVPGWDQFYKGERLRGGIINGGGYTDVTGTEWKLQLPTGANTWRMGSSHTIEIRAVDILGFSSFRNLTVRKGKNKDIDGDVYPDVIVGAPLYNSDQGLVNIFYSRGSTGVATQDLSAGGSAGATLTGFGNIRFGSSVALGDVNGEGFANVLVGTPLSYGHNKAYIYSIRMVIQALPQRMLQRPIQRSPRKRSTMESVLQWPWEM